MNKLAKAYASARAVMKGADYTGAVPLPVELAQHPATTAAPTETYPNPADMGGWRYVIEDAAQTWIAFVDVLGKALLWTKLDADGGVIGVPYGFQRDDLGRVAAAAAARRVKGGRVAVSLTAAAAALPTGPRVAPVRVRIWRAGANPGDYGACNLTPKAAAMVVAAYEARGNLAAIDIEHGTNPKVNPSYDRSKPPPGGGYYAVKVVDSPTGPELWADPIRWSDYARSEIESGSRGYISPDWDMTTDTNEPVRLNKISLVLEPGTYSVNMLASASASRGFTTMNEIFQLRAAYAALLAMADSTDPDVKAHAVALCASLKEKATALGIDLEAAPDAALDGPPVVADADTAPPVAPTPAVPGAARAVASRHLSVGDVADIFRQEHAKRDLLGLASTNREGMTPALANVLASKSLTEVRAIVGALPMKTVAAIANATTTATDGKVPVVQLGATAGAGAVDTAAPTGGATDLTTEEGRDVESMRKQLGLTTEAVTASREACSKGVGGVISIARIREMKSASIAAHAAKVSAAK